MNAPHATIPRMGRSAVASSPQERVLTPNCGDAVITLCAGSRPVSRSSSSIYRASSHALCRVHYSACYCASDRAVHPARIDALPVAAYPRTPALRTARLPSPLPRFVWRLVLRAYRRGLQRLAVRPDMRALRATCNAFTYALASRSTALIEGRGITRYASHALGRCIGRAFRATGAYRDAPITRAMRPVIRAVRRASLGVVPRGLAGVMNALRVA